MSGKPFLNPVEILNLIEDLQLKNKKDFAKLLRKCSQDHVIFNQRFFENKSFSQIALNTDISNAGCRAIYRIMLERAFEIQYDFEKKMEFDNNGSNKDIRIDWLPCFNKIKVIARAQNAKHLHELANIKDLQYIRGVGKKCFHELVLWLDKFKIPHKYKWKD